MKQKRSVIQGFTLPELIVVVAIIGIAVAMGTNYLFTNLEMYRFQKVLTDFKSALNLARVRSISGRVVSSGDITGQTSTVIPIASMQIDGNIVTLTRTTSLPSLAGGSYLTLQGLSPVNYVSDFPYALNGCLYKVTSSSGNSLTVQFLNQDPSNANFLNEGNLSLSLPLTSVKSSAYAFLKYTVKITGVDSIEGGAYSEVSETGPEMVFKYNQKTVKVGVTKGSSKQDQPIILFDKGLLVSFETYTVAFALLKSEAVASNVTISPTGAVR